MDKALRNRVIEFINNQYGAEAEYPWEKYSDYAVFRHTDNKKWFALIMSVGRDKIGLTREGMIDVINLKIDDPILHDELIHEDGISVGYHMNKQHWITVLLDGTVPYENICGLVDMSFQATASKRKKNERQS